MSRREVLTLQFGPFANAVGSHFWNNQVSASLEDGPASVGTDGCCGLAQDELFSPAFAGGEGTPYIDNSNMYYEASTSVSVD
jgi:hypothetical protein